MMKHRNRVKRFAAVLFFALAFVTPSFAANPVGKVIVYGIFKTTEKQLIKTPETPSGITRLGSANLNVIAITNRIPSKRGLTFGIVYEISNLGIKDGDFVEVNDVTKCPPIKKPDGTICESFTSAKKLQVHANKVGTFSGYTFDLDYEMVAGNWNTEILLNGKPVVTQAFTVYNH